MLLGSRQSLWRSGRLSAKSYVQDGLILQLDGIENAGYGVHKEGTAWTDLVSGENAVSQKNHFIKNAARFDMDGYFVLPRTLEDMIKMLGRRFTLEYIIGNEGFPMGDGTLHIVSRFGSYFEFKANLKGNGGWRNYQMTFPSAKSVNSPSGWNGRVHSFVFAMVEGNVDNFLNGAPDKSTEVGVSPVRGAYYHIGAGYDGAHSFRGLIYAIRIYNRALTPEEITTNYTIDKERFGL